MKHSGRSVATLAAASLLLAAGCAEETQTVAPVSTSPVGPVPAAEQRDGDPAAGLAALVNGGYDTCGMPYRAYRRMAEPVKAADLGIQREGRNAELPYMLTSYTTSSGVELVTTNCLGCHAAYFEGKLIIGLGNETLDFTVNPALNAERAGAYVRGATETAAWQKWADRLNALGPYIMTETVGVNPAPSATVLLMAHRDPVTMAWSPDPLLEPPPRPPLPVSVPPWWRMQKKHAMFYHTAGRGDHARMMMMKSLVCTDTVEEARRIDRMFPDIRAYLAALEPPRFPFPVGQEVAKRGRQVFELHCARCHGTYGEDESYPNLVVSVEEVGTDPLYATQSVKDAGRFVRWFNTSFYGEVSQAAPAMGYIAPPLDGVWATAPYLHNGSIPTIASLLESSTRPKNWLHPGKEPAFDPTALGWRVEALAYGKSGAQNDDERKHIYDTSLPGHDNGGHTFGDVLSGAERAAVLEYLKTL